MFDADTGLWEECPFMAYSQKVQMKAGAPYKLRSRILINKMPKKLYLNAEIQRLTKLSVNGTDLSYHKNIERWTTADYTEDVTALFSEGENIICVEGVTTEIRMVNKPPYLFLSGDFTLGKQDAIEAPVCAINADGWEKNGYPYYTGVGVYQTSVTVEPGFNKATLTVNTEDIADIYVNGQLAGTKLWLKDETDITACVKPGKNEILVRITSTRANSFACQCFVDEWASQKAEVRTENGVLAPMRVTFYQ